MKTKTIKLTDGWAGVAPDFETKFRVEQVTNSLDYTCGQLLERREVDSLLAPV
jgi:hypothetical protein